MAKTDSDKKKYIFLLLRIAVISAAIIFVAVWLSKEQRWQELKNIFLSVNPLVFAVALGLCTVGHFMVGLRWWILLRSQKIFISYGASVKLYFLGWFYNNFMPSSVGGDLIRAWYVTQHTEKKFEAALSVFVDRIIGLLSTLVIAGFFYLLFLRGQTGIINAESDQRSLLSTIYDYRWVFIWVGLAGLAVLAGLSAFGQGRGMLKKIYMKISLLALKALAKLREAITVYSRSKLSILAAFALTICLQIMTITGFWILGVNMGIDVSVKYYYVFFTLMWVVGALPISVGGAGVVEGGLAYLFIKFAGAEPEAALAIALSQRFVWMITSLPGALIHLLGAHLPKEILVDYKKSIK
ncbi:lysylphosphatidylglycerol synthase transmembrane domain-containing protein [Planctomycetota bacterium]